MPRYRRNYRNRRRRYRRYPRKKLTYGRIGRKIYRDVSYLKNMINTEFKSEDVVTTINPDNTAGSSGSRTLLNALTRGDTIDTRDGRQVRFKSVQVNINSVINTSATDTRVFVALVIDKQPNQNAPTYAQVFDQGQAMFRNLDWRKRFVVLRKWIIKLNQDYPEQVRNLYKKIDMKTVYNDGNTGTVTDITTNALYLVHLSDEPTNTPSVTLSTRLRFIDN